MTLLQAWVLFPLICAGLTLGCGLLVDRVAGQAVPAALVMPLGLGTIIVAGRLVTETDATAELASPLVVVLALAGFWLGRERLRLPTSAGRWALGAALAVFVVYAAPTVLNGSASFAGYTILGDTAVHFTLVDRLATHGSDLSGLAPSSYRETLVNYLGAGYPLGTHAALGALRPLAFADVAWLFQPFLAFMAAMLALTLIGLLRGFVRSGWRVAAVAFVAAQPALAYAYALQGSVKEIATLWLVPLIAATVAGLREERWPGTGAESRPGDRESLLASAGRLLPLLVASAAGLAAIGPAVAVWLGPMLLVALWLVARWQPRDWGRLAGLAAVFAVALAVISIPTLTDARKYVDVAGDVVTAQEEVGNLAHPLPLIEVAGIWLEGDYRFTPTDGAGIDKLELTYLLIGLAAVAALLGTAWLLRRRALGPLLFAVSSLIALWYVTRTGSPWADGKALAIASPAVLLLAALGPVALEALGARLEAMLLALAIAAGVLASNALAYHDVSLAPRDRLEELAEVGDRAAGQGPLLYTEFEEFGKHFLREADPVGASEGFAVPGLSPELRKGGRPPFAQPVSARSLKPADLARFSMLVQRRSPYGERPPGDWERIWTGDYYELWRNRARGRAATGLGPVACPAPPVLMAAYRPLPAGWTATSDRPPLVQTVGQGTVRGTIGPRATGRYEVWLSGSFGRDVVVRIDGREVGRIGDELAQPAGWVQLGAVALRRGRHDVELVRGGGNLEPGNGDGPRKLGSLVLRPVGLAAEDGC